MKFRKSSPEIIELFEAALPLHPDVEPKKMFGYPAAWVNGHYFTGLFEEQVIIRLPDEIRLHLPEMKGAEVFNPMGTKKGMNAWWVVPDRIARSVPSLAIFLERALAEVRKLPPKAPKPKKGAAKTNAASLGATLPGTPAAKRAAAKVPAKAETPAKPTPKAKALRKPKAKRAR